jgi:hypothetical protein
MIEGPYTHTNGTLAAAAQLVDATGVAEKKNVVRPGESKDAATVAWWQFSAERGEQGIGASRKSAVRATNVPQSDP